MTTLVREQTDRIAYTEARATWQTPRGHDAVFFYRQDTSDWNTISSVLNDDEYGLADLRPSGRALDIGAHIGAVAITLALDNPDLEVIAVEALSENVELLRRNVAANGLTDWILVRHAAAAGPKQQTAEIRHRTTGSESASHHAFIGNSGLAYPDATPYEIETVACVPLRQLTNVPVSLMKIDCEGCEYGFLADPAVRHVERIVGEWHNTDGHDQQDIAHLLRKTHDVTFSGPVEGPGGFVAVRR